MESLTQLSRYVLFVNFRRRSSGLPVLAPRGPKLALPRDHVMPSPMLKMQIDLSSPGSAPARREEEDY